MLIVNFGHPLVEEHLAEIAALSGRAVEKVIDVRADFDHQGSLPAQARSLVDRCGLSPQEWETVPLVVGVPTLHVGAAAVLAELHGRIGHFPAVIRQRPTPDAAVPRFEVAEIVNLQALRDEARRRRDRAPASIDVPRLPQGSPTGPRPGDGPTGPGPGDDPSVAGDGSGSPEASARVPAGRDPLRQASGSGRGRQEASRFERIFSPRSSRDFIGFALVAICINLVSSAVPNLRPGLAAVASTALLALLFSFWWTHDRLAARRRSRQVAFNPTRQAPERARGLVLLLGPYRAQSRGEDHDAAMRRVLSPAAGPLDPELFQRIGLQSSNLRPQIEAIAYHSQGDVLRDLWLISGSKASTTILERYVGQRHPGVRVHTTVDGRELDVEAWNYTDAWKKAEMVFRASPYRDRVMLADVTGGTKTMSIAVAMACIPPGRRLQYMDSERDHTGLPLPQGQVRPVLIDIDPILYPDDPVNAGPK